MSDDRVDKDWKYPWGSDREPDLNLGDDHWLDFFRWAPDRELNPQYADRPDVPKAGAIVGHKTKEGNWCWSAVHFDLPETKGLFDDDTRWQVVSWEPLTLTPSLLCNVDKGGCGDHGFVTNGK